MKLQVLVAGAVALIAFAGCSAGSPVDGTWCPVGGTGKLTLSGGKVTSTQSAEGGTYKVSGKEVTLTEDNGRAMVLTMSDNDTMSVGPLTFKRCN